MGARQHGQPRVLEREGPQCAGDLRQFRQQQLCAGPLQQPRVAEIVEVLGGAAKMHQFQRRRARTRLGQLLAHVVFDRLDVVIDPRLDLLDRGGGLGPGIAGQGVGACPRRCAECGTRQLRLGLDEFQQPQGLDADPFPDQPGFAEQCAQGFGRGRVAAINRGNGQQVGLIHAVGNARG